MQGERGASSGISIVSCLIMKRLRGNLTLAALRRAVQESGLTDSLKELAGLRLNFAEEYIDDACRLTEILRPGRIVIVDLRDEFIDKDEALGLFASRRRSAMTRDSHSAASLRSIGSPALDGIVGKSLPP